MSQATTAGRDIALVAMPFGGLHTPSLALSLLHVELEREGITSDLHYLSLAFAERLGIDRYDRYAENVNGAFLGEWLFSHCLFPALDARAERFIEEVLIPMRRFTIEEITRIEGDRDLARSFLEECLGAVDWGRYRIIGFTTTFEQNTASLALARMLKERLPETILMFGGANCEGGMGVQMRRSFPWIDYVCTGEGDEVVPELVRQVLGRSPWTPLPGVVGGRHDPPLPSKMVINLDRLPIPDYSAYFDRLDGSPLRADLRCWLPMETSRGCWWGEKHHCTFCGLNGSAMRFRSKSPARALDEIRQLAGTYGDRVRPSRSFFLTDNILDLKYLTTLMPALRDAGLDVSLFYETKANLTREQVRLLAAAGVRELQPGIESLHSALLRLMRKGCTALQNVQLLKWCREFGVTPRWNILFGFPGEDPAWFDQQVDVIRRILHLKPPSHVCPVRLDRFSPYFADPAAHGISNVRPERALSHVYDLPPDEVVRLVYHFDFEYDDGRVPSSYIVGLVEAVDEWKAVAGERFFYGLPRGERLILWDGRHGDPGEVHVLEGGARLVYEFCDRLRSHREIVAHACCASDLTESQAVRLLDEWTAAGLMLEDEGCHLSLAVMAGAAMESCTPVYPISSQSASIRARDGIASLRPCRDRALKSIGTGHESIVLDPVRARILFLEGLAGDVWNRCDGRSTVPEIARQVAPGDSTSGRRSEAVVGVIQHLIAEGLVEWQGAGSPGVPAGARDITEPRP